MSNTQLKEVITDLYNKIHVLSTIQNVLMEHIADDNQELQLKIMASTFAIEGFRNSFTDFVFKEVDNDDVKIFVTEMNMMAEQFKSLQEEE